MPEYMHPTGGALNLAASLPAQYIPPDLGPKGYIAFGREQEHEGEGDSVTRLHLDLSDAINIVCHVQRPDGASKQPPPARCGDAMPELPGYGSAGAVWDLFRREDLATLRQFLTDAAAGKVPGCPPFIYKGALLTPERVNDVIHDQSFMLTEAHRRILRERYNVHAWVVEQNEWEGVVIPSNCAHQVRNLRSCIKIALDFVSPESLDQCLILREEMRALAQREVPQHALKPDEEVAERHFHDKLQVGNMALFALEKAVAVLQGKEARNRGSGSGTAHARRKRQKQGREAAV